MGAAQAQNLAYAGQAPRAPPMGMGAGMAQYQQQP